MTNPWWRGAVIYQVYPRSFADANGDGVGDLPGIVARLDHVQSLGVDAVWVSPFFKSPMKDHGYDVADYRAVDPLFGTLDDADRLIASCHARGLRLIIDLVPAHTSDRHPWFVESRADRANRRADWYVWADPKPDGTPPNNWLSVFGGPAWQWEPRRGQYYLHHFLKAQPNLNWHNPAVAAAMLDEVAFWFDRGVDGLRLDAITTTVHDPALRDNPPAAPDTLADVVGARQNPFAFQEHRYDRDRPELMAVLGRLRALAERYPDRFLMGEVADVDSIAVAAKYTQGGGALHSAYTFQFTKDAFGTEILNAVLGRTESLMGDGWITHAFGNHDTERAVSRWGRLAPLAGDDRALAKLLMACLLSLRGGACVYQGDELGLPQAELAFEDLRDPWGIEFWPLFKGRDGCRTPMPWRADAPHAGFSAARPWLPVPAAHRALAVDRQDGDPDSVLNAYRRFLAWRKGQGALIHGAFAARTLPDPVFAFERGSGDDRLLCAFNLSNRPVAVAVEPGWRPLDGHGFPAAALRRGRLALPAFGAFFAAPARPGQNQPGPPAGSG